MQYRDIATCVADQLHHFGKVLQKTHGLIEGIYMLMATLRSAKHQQLMFPLKNSVSKVKRCNISFTNLLFIKQLKFTFLYNITWLLNHTQLPTDLAFWNLLFLHGAECKSRLNLVRGNYLCHQSLKCHKWWRHNFSLQY